MNKKAICLLLVYCTISSIQSYHARPAAECRPSVTTVSGPYAPNGRICSGQVLLSENFNEFDRSIWKNEIAMGGGGNNEFQWYVDDAHNSFVKDGKMVLRPSLTVDEIGDELESGHIKLDPCTNTNWNGCEHEATSENIVKPVRSARLHTEGSFAFKYGILEITAKMPSGDWLWPALWLLPQNWTYGGWPRSGEIDLLESRGNRQLLDHNNVHIGVEQFGSTLHFGPRWDQNAYSTSTFGTSSQPGNGFDRDFHKYKLEWTPQHLRFFLDHRQVAEISVGDGFWSRGKFSGENIWKDGTMMAPFDQEFYLIMNLAVGGTNGYFPDSGNSNGKPWTNSQSFPHTAFWRGKQQWLDSWKLNENNGMNASMIIDSVKIWAL